MSRLVTWQHEDTGYIFTKEIPDGEPTPIFPHRFVVSEEQGGLPKVQEYSKRHALNALLAAWQPTEAPPIDTEENP